MDLTKVANVLEAVASYVEAHEAEQQSKVAAVRESLIASIGEKFTSATGEEVSDELLKKLAAADIPVLEAMEKVAEVKKEPDPADMGHSSGRRDLSVAPETKKEATELADEQFLDWITGQ